MKNKDNLLIIDRFENEWAVIEYGDTMFNLPKSLLPKEAKEGDVLDFVITTNEDELTKRKKQIEELTKKLFKEE